MLEEVISFDQITIEASGTILCRQSLKILKDGSEISKSYHRYSFTPGSDISVMPQNIQDIANLVWTPEIISAAAQQVAIPVE